MKDTISEKSQSLSAEQSTATLIETQQKIFKELQITIEEQKEVNQLVNLFVFALFLIMTMYFFVV